MRTVLHILTRPEGELAHTLFEAQRGMPGIVLEVVDLTKDPDYDALVDRIFAADCIEVW